MATLAVLLAGCSGAGAATTGSRAGSVPGSTSTSARPAATVLAPAARATATSSMALPSTTAVAVLPATVATVEGSVPVVATTAAPRPPSGTTVPPRVTAPASTAAPATVAATLPPPPTAAPTVPPTQPPASTYSGCSTGGLDTLNSIRATAGAAAVGGNSGAAAFACEWVRHLLETEGGAHSSLSARNAACGTSSTGEAIGGSWTTLQNSAAHLAVLTSAAAHSAGIGKMSRTYPDGAVRTLLVVVLCA